MNSIPDPDALAALADLVYDGNNLYTKAPNVWKYPIPDDILKILNRITSALQFENKYCTDYFNSGDESMVINITKNAVLLTDAVTNLQNQVPTGFDEYFVLCNTVLDDINNVQKFVH